MGQFRGVPAIVIGFATENSDNAKGTDKVYDASRYEGDNIPQSSHVNGQFPSYAHSGHERRIQGRGRPTVVGGLRELLITQASGEWGPSGEIRPTSRNMDPTLIAPNKPSDRQDDFPKTRATFSTRTAYYPPGPQQGFHLAPRHANPLSAQPDQGLPRVVEKDDLDYENCSDDGEHSAELDYRHQDENDLPPRYQPRTANETCNHRYEAQGTRQRFVPHEKPEYCVPTL